MQLSIGWQMEIKMAVLKCKCRLHFVKGILFCFQIYPNNNSVTAGIYSTHLF